MQFSNTNLVMDDILDDLISSEKQYLNTLQEIIMVDLVYFNRYFDAYCNAFECLESIYNYHRAQFVYHISNITSAEDFIDFFFKHKSMLYLYEDFFATEPYISWLYKNFPGDVRFGNKLYVEVEDRKVTILERRLVYFVKVLKDLRRLFYQDSTEPSKCNTAINIINEIRKNGPDAKTGLLAEMILHERLNMQKLTKFLNTIDAAVENTQSYLRKKEYLLGTLPDIIREQTMLRNDLENCLYYNNIFDFMDYYKKYKNAFDLYREGYSKINFQLFYKFSKECNLTHEDEPTWKILIKYRLFFDTLVKLYKAKPEAVEKINEISSMIKPIIQDMNDIYTVKQIFDENIDLFQQGKLLKRGEITVAMPQKLLSFRKKLYVFLFEKALVFTTEEKSSNIYVYVHHILNKNIQIGTLIDKNLTIYDKKITRESDKYIFTMDDKQKGWYEEFKSIIVCNIFEQNTYLAPKSKKQ